MIDTYKALPSLVIRTWSVEINMKNTCLALAKKFILQIDHEEYGEALLLAKGYGLDCDLVYQRQWRKTPVSVASIQDYLVNCQVW